MPNECNKQAQVFERSRLREGLSGERLRNDLALPNHAFLLRGWQKQPPRKVQFVRIYSISAREWVIGRKLGMTRLVGIVERYVRLNGDFLMVSKGNNNGKNMLYLGGKHLCLLSGASMLMALKFIWKITFFLSCFFLVFTPLTSRISESFGDFPRVY